MVRRTDGPSDPKLNPIKTPKVDGPKQFSSEKTNPASPPVDVFLNAAKKVFGGIISDSAVSLLGKLTANRIVGGVEDSKGKNLNKKA